MAILGGVEFTLWGIAESILYQGVIYSVVTVLSLVVWSLLVEDIGIRRGSIELCISDALDTMTTANAGFG